MAKVAIPHDLILEIKLEEFNQFIHRWQQKANVYNGKDELTDYFDKYFTLYVILNRIYNLIVVSQYENGDIDKMIKEKRLKPTHKQGDFAVSDNQAATTCVSYFLKDELEGIVEEQKDPISSYIEMIKKSEFNFVLLYGNPQQHEDRRIKDDLESTDKFLIVKGLLTILYNIRNNIFHGEKGYNDNQKKLLAISITCIESFIHRLMKKVPLIKPSIRIRQNAHV